MEPYRKFFLGGGIYYKVTCIRWDTQIQENSLHLALDNSQQILATQITKAGNSKANIYQQMVQY